MNIRRIGLLNIDPSVYNIHKYYVFLIFLLFFRILLFKNKNRDLLKWPWPIILSLSKYHHQYFPRYLMGQSERPWQLTDFSITFTVLEFERTGVPLNGLHQGNDLAPGCCFVDWKLWVGVYICIRPLCKDRQISTI